MKSQTCSDEILSGIESKLILFFPARRSRVEELQINVLIGLSLTWGAVRNGPRVLMMLVEFPSELSSQG